LLPPLSGRYELSVAANDGARLWLDGRLVIDEWTTAPRLRALSTFVDLDAGKPHELRLEYFEDERDAEVRLGWRLPGAKPLLQEALDATRGAEVVVFVGGLTGDVEGEEMEASFPGFAGGDRTDLRLPKTQQNLLEALRATGKPIVMVLNAGSALAIDWAQKNLPAILLAWYPGQRGGDAVADVLFGDANPGGRLPVTFYRADEKLPPFDDYAMRGRTYRYFAGKPLYSFGYGLSYTQFAYSELHLDRDRVGANDPLHISVRVKNAGQRIGDEVVQLYLRPINPQRERAIHELRAIQRVTLQPGEARDLAFSITPATDLRIYDDALRAYAADPGAYEVEVGASSGDIRVSGRFAVDSP